MESRYIPNNFSPLLTLGDTEPHFKDALEDIVTNYPPREVYPGDMLAGLWKGPSGIAYLLFHVSTTHPRLKIAGHHALTWAKEYMRGSHGHLRVESSRCGIHSEKLVFEAVQAVITKDLAHVDRFLSTIPGILTGDYPDELLNGRAGVLYLLRLIRYWVPDSASVVEPAIASVSEMIMSDGPQWKWHGTRYLGAIHGDISIVTQLVLTTPSLAQQLEPKLNQLLSMQGPDGNWPTSEGKGTPSLTQFCHGAPGFVLSLISLRPFFPNLQRQIDSAIKNGRECIWREGLLRKQPSLCHGIFSNALALAQGVQRDHFLAVATPENVKEMKKRDKTIFEPADYGARYGTLTSYAPSAAWAWMVHKQDSPGIIAYNDV